MSSEPAPSRAAVIALLENFSLEMTGKDVGKLADARSAIPGGTRVNVTFLGNEDLEMRLGAVRAVREFGFVPVPHISARRLASAEQLVDYLTALQDARGHEEVFVVGGDPATPEGPYSDSLEVINSGLLQQHGVQRVGISGYPEGHPDISAAALWSALEGKFAVLQEQQIPGTIITQFGFDADATLAWAEQVRQRGIDLPIRVGVPGPAGVKRLLSYAKRFGVGTSTSIAKKYGLSITNLMSTAGPDAYLSALAAGHDPARHGELELHFYTFGGLKATADWVTDFRKQA